MINVNPNDYNPLNEIYSFLFNRKMYKIDDNPITVEELHLIQKLLSIGGVICETVYEVVDCLYVLESLDFVTLERLTDNSLKVKLKYGK